MNLEAILGTRQENKEFDVQPSMCAEPRERNRGPLVRSPNWIKVIHSLPTAMESSQPRGLKHHANAGCPPKEPVKKTPPKGHPR